jgi:hypothetical protein
MTPAPINLKLLQANGAVMPLVDAFRDPKLRLWTVRLALGTQKPGVPKG